MAFIRSGSNPERLYIFGSDKYVTICWTDWDGHPRNESITIEDWDAFWQSYKDSDDPENPISCPSLKFTSSVLYDFNSHTVLDTYPKTLEGAIKTSHLEQLQVNDKYLRMWTTTWEYLVQSVYRHYGWEIK